MPPKNFPLPLAIGTDICQISRIYGILKSSNHERFIRKVFTRSERAHYSQRLHLDGRRKAGEPHTNAVPIHTSNSSLFEEAKRLDPSTWELATFVAGRFAAKEAIIKSHIGRRKLTFQEITIGLQPEPYGGRGQNAAFSRGPVAVAEFGEGDEVESPVSISHDGDYATAVSLGWTGTARAG